MIFHRKALDFHANGMRFTARDKIKNCLLKKEFYSFGGGFVVTESDDNEGAADDNHSCFPYPFKTADELLKLCMLHKCSMSHIMFNNEKARLSEHEIREKLLTIWKAMQQCVQRGLAEEGILPGGMKVKRRAANLYRQLINEDEQNKMTTLWIGLIFCFSRQ